jgi:hypothetical protein
MQILQLRTRQGVKPCTGRYLLHRFTSSSTPHSMEAIYPNPGNEVSVDQDSETCVSIVSMLKQHSECADGLF